MFKPSTDRVLKLSEMHPESIKQLESIFNKPTAIYIDFANVIHWSKKLKWRIDIKRLKQLHDSFDTVKYIRFYNGFVEGDTVSEGVIKSAQDLGYDVVSKPVKKMHLPIDVSSIPNNSPLVLENFIKRSLLNKFSIETIEYLNNRLRELNEQGIKSIEHWKCNFDVEIGRDILVDHEHNGIDNFVLWSGDSDFADPIIRLLKDKKAVSIFATARRITPELSATGVFIFEIWKIKDFICWKKDLTPATKQKLQIK